MSLLTNLISYWKLDEASGTRVDSHGSNDLTMTGSIGSATGIINSGASFPNDAQQRLTHATNSDLETGDIDFSFSGWVNFTSHNDYNFIVSKSAYADNDIEYGLYYDPNDNRIEFFVNPTGSSTSTQVKADNFGTFGNGSWHHIICWHDSVNDLIGICVDDGTPNTAAHSTGVFVGTAPFGVGLQHVTATSYANGFNGVIDEIAFWKRVLTSGERTALYNSGAGLAYSSFGGGIQFDAASNSGYQAAASSYSWSHTCTGADRFLAVDVSMLSAGQTVSGITYNGVALSFIGARSTVSSVGRIECWGLIAPATGSNTIAVTLSGAIASAGAAVSYTGVNQTTAVEAFNSNQATNVGAADATVTITTIADQDWVHATIATNDASVTAGQTTRNNVTGAGGSGADEDTGPLAAATGQAMTYTGVGALSTWAIGGYGIRPVSASTTYSVSVTESSSATNTDSAVLVTRPSVLETGSAADTNFAAATFLTSSSELANGADLPTSSALFSSSFVEAATATDSVSAASIFAASLAEVATGLDTVNCSAIFNSIVSETATAVDTVQGSIGGVIYSVSVSEAAVSSDSIGCIAVFGSTSSEAASSSDSTDAAAAFANLVSETASGSDLASITASFFSSITETASATDSWTTDSGFTYGRYINVIGYDATRLEVIGYDATTLEVTGVA